MGRFAVPGEGAGRYLPQFLPALPGIFLEKILDVFRLLSIPVPTQPFLLRKTFDQRTAGLQSCFQRSVSELRRKAVCSSPEAECPVPGQAGK